MHKCEDTHIVMDEVTYIADEHPLKKCGFIFSFEKS